MNDCPGCKVAKENALMVMENVNIINPVRLEKREKRIRDLFSVFNFLSSLENIKFDMPSTAKFLDNRESPFRKVKRGSWFQ